MKLLLTLVIVIATAVPAFAGSTALAGSVLDAARDCERRGEWSRACDIYGRMIAERGRTPGLTAAMARCGRRIEQARRLNDPSYRDYARSLTLSQALDVYAEVTSKLESLYPERGRATPSSLYQQALAELADALGDPAFPAGASALRPIVLAASSATNPSDAVSAREAIKTIALAGKRLVGVDVGLVVLECAAGACAGLDEFSLYLHPARDDELTGLGITLAIRDRQRIISRIVVGSWAANAELKPGDRVTRVGEEGDEIEVMTPGEAPRLIRLPLPPSSVAEVEAIRGTDLGYLRIGQFNKSLPMELDSALGRLRSSGVKALVLDLRGVPGGLLSVAVQAAERFLPRGTIATAKGQQANTNRTYTAAGNAIDMPMVVLVDSATASAAEVLAGALKDNGRAVLVGQMTYGKAAVQGVVPLDVGGGIRVTLARLFGPDGGSIHGVGIAPHHFELNTDRQLVAALELANKLLRQPEARP